MTTFTIHAEEATADALRTAAKESNMSINKYILSVLNGTLGLAEKKNTRPQFLNIPHTISKTEATRLHTKQADFEQIDKEMWK